MAHNHPETVFFTLPTASHPCVPGPSTRESGDALLRSDLARIGVFEGKSADPLIAHAEAKDALPIGRAPLVS